MKNKKIDHIDQDFMELSIMFYEDEKDPTFGKEYLNLQMLDYSIGSLDQINVYLSSIMKDPKLEESWNKVVLRCGAYVGEVIRRNYNVHKFHWYEYDNAKKIGNKHFNQLKYAIGTAAVLYREDDFFCFPLAKVEKFLDHGPEHNIKTFVQEILKQ